MSEAPYDIKIGTGPGQSTGWITIQRGEDGSTIKWAGVPPSDLLSVIEATIALELEDGGGEGAEGDPADDRFDAYGPAFEEVRAAADAPEPFHCETTGWVITRDNRGRIDAIARASRIDCRHGWVAMFRAEPIPLTAEVLSSAGLLALVREEIWSGESKAE